MALAKPVADRERKYFSVAEANRSLPLVKAIVADIVGQARKVESLHNRLESVLRGPRKPLEDMYSEELAQTQSELEAEEEKLQGYSDELKNLGVELKSDEIGLCDFRSLLNGREVYLCWRLGETEVSFWHELEAGYAGRQEISPHTRTLLDDKRF